MRPTWARCEEHTYGGLLDLLDVHAPPGAATTAARRAELARVLDRHEATVIVDETLPSSGAARARRPSRPRAP